MNLKKDLKDIGYVLITPIPKKYHFEGVDNRRAGRNMQILGLTMQAALIGGIFLGPAVISAASDLITRAKKNLKKS